LGVAPEKGIKKHKQLKGIAYYLKTRELNPITVEHHWGESKRKGGQCRESTGHESREVLQRHHVRRKRGRRGRAKNLPVGRSKQVPPTQDTTKRKNTGLGLQFDY